MIDSAAQEKCAVAILEELGRQLERAVSGLARACLENGKLDSHRLDEEQVASYELAWANAELLAAKTSLAQLLPSSSELDRRLAFICASETILSVTERLRAVFLDVGFDPGDLDSCASSTEVRELRRSFLSGTALSETGRMLVESGCEVGRVVLDAELETAQEQLRRVATDLVAPLAEGIHRRNETVPEALLQPLREMGVFGLSIPERFGGSAPDDGDDTLMMLVASEALSEASLGAAGSLITRLEILASALVAGGTEEQKTHWLPKIAAGDPLCAIAITEPDYGSDVANLQLRGTRTKGGWLLNGAKTWCTFAGKAGLIMVVVRTDQGRRGGHRGLSVLLVEKPSYDGHAFEYVQDSGGRLTGRAIPTIGYRGMHSFDLSFEDFFVPDANVVGGEGGIGKGFYFTMAGMSRGRLQTAARASGVMRAGLYSALRYANERRVFGAPLSSYSLTRAKLARMAARYASCRQLTYALARLNKKGARSNDASLVKLYACRNAEWIAREAQQIHGGMGYAEESPVSRYFVDARVLSIFEGAEETLALKVIARGMLEEALRELHA